ncbi:MAG TPA: hypothetical protein VJR02_23315 [Pyrinomonadaceae bacterium]|nr:hypothetical protein [Pyrinomonadaceae bacterium]
MNNVVNLTDDEKTMVVHKKATCPFISAAVAQGHLAVRNNANNPLAAIEDVKNLGDSGGGHLGDVLELFANGNHAFMRSESGELNKPVPDGLFSLEFPGSQGSHTGHSGILQGDPTTLDSGRLDNDNFARLISRAKNGLIKRSDVGRFIAENVFRDPKSKVRGGDDASQSRAFFELMRDITLIVVNIFGDDVDHRDVQQRFTKVAAEDNLAGSAGEFGLLFAFLKNKPGANELDGEPALAVEDLKLMFIEKQLPAGWQTWEKSAFDWVRNTKALEASAREEYQRLKQAK